jgi:hypothetical protein
MERREHRQSCDTDRRWPHAVRRPARLEARIEEKSGIYSYETRPEALPEPYAAILRKNQAAWDDFRQRSPSYRRGAIGWVISAKAEATRLRRLAILIGCSAKGEPIPHLDRRPGADPRR